jgi:hypothetical protein
VHDERDDEAQLEALNERFIAYCRAGSWEHLRLILDLNLQYLDGGTGQTWHSPAAPQTCRPTLRRFGGSTNWSSTWPARPQPCRPAPTGKTRPARRTGT